MSHMAKSFGNRHAGNPQVGWAPITGKGLTGEAGMLKHIRWVRIIVAAVLVEVALLAIAIPLNMSANGRAILLALVIPLCVVGVFIGGWWAAQRASGLFVLHGLLVGIVAALIYGALTWKMSLPTAYVVANYLKLVAGAGGGAVPLLMRRNVTEAKRAD